VESEPELVYWLLSYRRSRIRLPGLSDLPKWAMHFGIQVTPLSQVPPQLEQEVACWFSNPEFELCWMQIQPPNNRLGFNFAVLLYLALHLRKVGGKRVQAMHLVANIEGKPNNRKNWRAESQ
jgi:hypothetical protein